MIHPDKLERIVDAINNLAVPATLAEVLQEAGISRANYDEAADALYDLALEGSIRIYRIHRKTFYGSRVGAERSARHALSLTGLRLLTDGTVTEQQAIAAIESLYNYFLRDRPLT